jgi:putative ABC transport system permease protein
MRFLHHGHLKAGLGSIRGAKRRSFWTVLGVIIGVTSVITIVSIGEGIKQQVGGQIHHLGQNVITIRPTQLLGGSVGGGGANSLTGISVSSQLNLRDIDVISRAPGIAASAPLTVVNGTARADHSYPDGFVIGTSSDLPSLLNQSMAYGAFFGDLDSGNNVAVLGQHASEALFNEDVPLGRSFEFRGQTFIVDGIFNQFTSVPLSQQADFNNAIFIPNMVAENLSKNTAPTYEVLARPTSSQATSKVIAQLKQALDKAHGGSSGLAVMSGNQNLTSSNNILELLTRLIAGVAAISLLVAGVGIMNVMLVSVTERSHEIGIRKAVGATNRQIMVQFMVEAGVLSLSGGIVGIILALLINAALRAATDLQPAANWQIIVIASGISLLVGIVFGTLPALKAARKDPIEALRSE